MHGPGEILPASAATYGDTPALITAARTLSYAELDDLSDRVAASLQTRGIGAGERVAIYSPNRWEWIVSYHGALKAGAIVNPINAMLTPEEVRFILRDSGAAALFTAADKFLSLEGTPGELGLRETICFEQTQPGTARFADYIHHPADTGFAPATVEATQPSTIGYTSGTTGHPKGAVQSHQAVLLNCQDTARMHGRTSADVVVTALPAPHVYGNVAINSTFLVGGTVVLMEQFDPGQALQLIEAHQATMFEGVPAMYAMLLSHDDLSTRELDSLTRCTVGGQTISRATIEAWEHSSGAPLIELWGMTELSGLGTTHWSGKRPVPGSIGAALPHAEVRVARLDDTTATANPGEPGELMVRGPLVMLGYFGNVDATAEVLEPDGWLHTGDIAYTDEDGHFFVVDRLKDMIITGGYNIYPAEIERVLAGHPDVAMVAVGPVPDEVKGELPRAYVVPRDGHGGTEPELIDYCRNHLAPYKLPRSVRFVDNLPQTSTGKIMRRELAKLAVEQP